MKSEALNIDDVTIRKLGLRPSNKSINAQIAAGARVFEYPGLDEIYIMESDLYGNMMPKGSCFLAFNGSHGLIGKHLKVETLMTLRPDEIRRMVESNTEG